MLRWTASYIKLFSTFLKIFQGEIFKALIQLAKLPPESNLSSHSNVWECPSHSALASAGCCHFNGNLCKFYKQKKGALFQCATLGSVVRADISPRVYWQTIAKTIYICSPSNYWGSGSILNSEKAQVEIHFWDNKVPPSFDPLEGLLGDIFFFGNHNSRWLVGRKKAHWEPALSYVR